MNRFDAIARADLHPSDYPGRSSPQRLQGQRVVSGPHRGKSSKVPEKCRRCQYGRDLEETPVKYPQFTKVFY
jgi:hypothetical protein